MKKLLQKQSVQGILSLVLFIVIILIIILFFEWLNIPDPASQRLMLYALLIVLCVPLWIESCFDNRLRKEHAKLVRDLDKIISDFEELKKETVKDEARKESKRKTQRLAGRKTKPNPKRLHSRRRKK